MFVVLNLINVIMNDKFVQGYMCALAQIIKLNGGIDVNAKEIFGCSPETVSGLIALGVDKGDVDLIRPLAVEFEKNINK